MLLEDLLTSMVSYAHALGVEYHVSILHALINNIVDDMISSSFFSSDTWTRMAVYSCDKAFVEAKNSSFFS